MFKKNHSKFPLKTLAQNVVLTEEFMIHTHIRMHTCMHTQVDCPGMPHPRSLQGPKTTCWFPQASGAAVRSSASDPTCAEHTEHGAALPGLVGGSLTLGDRAGGPRPSRKGLRVKSSMLLPYPMPW